MSTFTEWNGPPGGRGPRTKDVLDLIDAYNNMNAVLSRHLESTAVDNVHSFASALKEAIAGLESSVNATLALKADADTVSSLAETAASSEKEIMLESSRAIAAEAALQSAIDNEAARAQESELSLSDAISALEAALDETRTAFGQVLSQISFDDEYTTSVAGVFAVTEYIISTIKVRSLVDFIEWDTITAQYAGTGASLDARTHGLYILGRLSEEWDPDKGFNDEYKPKPARAYIKYIGNRPFDLVVDIAASGLKNGAITCAASFNKVWTEEDPSDAWEDMALHLVISVDSSGSSHVYLAISAKGLYGQPVQFHVSGVNFIAGGTVNGVSSSIGFTRVKQGFNAYSASFDDLRVPEIHDVYGDRILSVEVYRDQYFSVVKNLYISDKTYCHVFFLRRPSVIFDDNQDDGSGGPYVAPVLTGYDLDALSAGASMKGAIVFWPQWEEAEVNGVPVKRAVNVPEGWIACDGSTVSVSDYPTLVEILGVEESDSSVTLPCIDYAIMRLISLFENVELSSGSQVLDVMTPLELQKALNELQDDLVEEAETREAADIALQASIDEEEAARIEADANLQNSLSTETEQRVEADANLQDNIDIETSARIEADEQLQSSIDAEAQARSDADSALQDSIDAEAQARADADSALQDSIDAEAQARADADSALQDSIDAEAQARVDADFALQDSIDAEAQARADADSALQDSIDAEAQAREEADSALQSSIETLDDKKAESWTGTQAEFDSVKSELGDGTIVLSEDELEDT